MRARRRAFTLIELLVVIGIILLLAGLLLTGISAVRLAVQRAAVRTEIDHMMMGLEAYNNEFGTYPPGFEDRSPPVAYGPKHWTGNPGTNDAADLGSGLKLAAGTDCFQLQLRTITIQMVIQGGNSTAGPYYTPKSTQVNSAGKLCDRFGSPYRYFSDGRNNRDPSTGLRLPGRESGLKPVIWSVGEDMKQDDLNNNEDNPAPGESEGNGKVDDQAELKDDICSWFGN